MFATFLLLLLLHGDGTAVDIKEFLKKKVSLDLYADITNRNSVNNTYCSICCVDIGKDTVGKQCGSHTLCRYANKETGPACKGFVHVRFTDSEKQSLLDIHNTMRNKVASGGVTEGSPGPQPKASNMRMMEWSEELALIAERWAAQCIYGKDLCRDLEKFPVGQNIARGNLATNSELSLVLDWFNEVESFNPSEVPRYNASTSEKLGTSRYTQLVWADTYLLGCARAMFQSSKASRVSYKEHLICNYGPTGNIPNQPIYRIGEPCTACQEGTACMIVEYGALCSAELQDGFNENLDLRLSSGAKKRSVENPVAVFLVMLLSFRYFFVSNYMYFAPLGITQ